MGARPPLSIVIGTTEGWPYVEPALAAFRADAERVGAEVLIADGSGELVPAQAVLGPNVRWLASSSKTVFTLFAEALREVTGEIVAMTEDHAVPRQGWVDAILRAHSDHPEAAAIGGAIENASTDSLLGWASYFITQGPHMAPLGQRVVAMTTNEANVSYKLRAIRDFDDNGGQGFMAILHNRRLAENGEVLRVDDSMVVDHFEISGFGPTSAIHFHNGRTISAFQREQGMSAENWLRLAASLVLPLFRTTRQVSKGMAKGRNRRQLLASAPLTLWLDFCGGLGHLVGYVAGPGDSPRHLR
jgi:hypothetical protein